LAVIGDGALTGGMVYEALNDVGYNKTKITIILNDNQMSISKNVGGLSKYLNNLRTEPGYNKLKENINSTLSNYDLGKNLVTSLSKVKGSLKQLVVPSMIFEDMGIKYLGPIDGHDIEKMNEVFNIAKSSKGPVLIHTITKTGRGYKFAEKSPKDYHAVSPFDTDCGVLESCSSNSYSNFFGDSLCEIAREDKDVVAITAAMPDGTGLLGFAKEFPKRFFDVGIAEEHAVTLAAGMASYGIKPVFAVYSTFLQRSYDQVLHDVCIQNLPVVFGIDRAGIVGPDGETHQGIMDISFLSMMPNMTIIAPKCIEELGVLLRYAINKNSPVAIRYPRGGDVIKGMKSITEVKYGKWEIINNGEKVAIIATGKMVQTALLAKQILDDKGVNCTIINAIFIKPLDEECLEKLSKENYNILTVEDNMLNGGFGSMVLESLNRYEFKGRMKILAYDDKFIPHGNVELLYKENGLDPENIAIEALNLMR